MGAYRSIVPLCAGLADSPTDKVIQKSLVHYGPPIIQHLVLKDFDFLT